MKKILYSIFAIALALPAVASAATFSFAPTSVTLAPGKVFSTVVFVSPGAGEKITTAKLSLKFPANLLEVVSFTPATGWIALSLPGSDLVDNTNGKLIKTGGLPAKVTSIKQFGIIVFKAKVAGNAKISTNADSMLIDTANANKYTASTGANFNIVKPTPKKPIVKPVSKPKSKVKTTFIKKKKSVVTKAKAVIETTKATTTPIVATTTATTTSDVQGQTANVSGSTKSGGFFNTKTIAFGIIFILLIIGWLFVLKKKKA